MQHFGELCTTTSQPLAVLGCWASHMYDSLSYFTHSTLPCVCRIGPPLCTLYLTHPNAACVCGGSGLPYVSQSFDLHSFHCGMCVQDPAMQHGGGRCTTTSQPWLVPACLASRMRCHISVSTIHSHVMFCIPPCQGSLVFTKQDD
jgi:hypothetical protein